MNIKIDYLAGLFDGEGSICIIRSTRGKFAYRHFISASIGMTDPKVLFYLKSKYGGYISINNPTELTRKKCYVWKLSELKAKRFIEEIGPHLIIKRKQFLLAIKYFSGFVSLTKGPKKIRLTEDDKKQLSFRDKFWVDMRKLNGNTRWVGREMNRIYI